MSLRVDLEKALENLRTTRKALDSDIRELERLVEEHLNLTNPAKMTGLLSAVSRAVGQDGNP